jgi:hypothetical protein
VVNSGVSAYRGGEGGARAAARRPWDYPGLARGEGLAILGQRGGMDREEHQKVVLLQGIDERALGKLEAHGNGLPLEALSQCTRPRLDGIGAVGYDAGLSPSGVGGLQADLVFGIGPIDADEGGEVVACRLRLHEAPPKC